MKTSACALHGLSFAAACGASEAAAEDAAYATEELVGGRAGAMCTMSNAGIAAK